MPTLGGARTGDAMPRADRPDQQPTIRQGRPRDVARIVAMIGELAAYHGDTATVSAEDLDRAIFDTRPWADLLVAELDGMMVGYAILWRLFRGVNGRRALELDHLYVAADHRGKGVGSRLVQAVIDHAHALGCGHVGVGTTPANTRAQAFYRDHGFQQTPGPGPRFRLSLVPSP